MRKKSETIEPSIVASHATERRVFLQGVHPEFNGKTRMNAYLHIHLDNEAREKEWSDVAETFARHSAIPAPTWSNLMIEAVYKLLPDQKQMEMHGKLKGADEDYLDAYDHARDFNGRFERGR